MKHEPVVFTRAWHAVQKNKKTASKLGQYKFKIKRCGKLIIVIISPLTMRVIGAPQMILQPVSSIFLCSLLPSGNWRTPACPFPDIVFPPLPLSALSSTPFHCALQDGFGQT